MRRFEDIHATEQTDILLELLKFCADNNTNSVARAAADNDITVLELWQDICATCGYDECVPWRDYPAKPRPSAFFNAPGANQPPPDWLERLWKQLEPMARQLH